jgi:hypothetical protein
MESVTQNLKLIRLNKMAGGWECLDNIIAYFPNADNSYCNCTTSNSWLIVQTLIIHIAIVQLQTHG